MRTALGVPPGAGDVPAALVVRGSAEQRLRRAADVALAADQWPVGGGRRSRTTVTITIASSGDPAVASATLVAHPTPGPATSAATDPEPVTPGPDLRPDTDPDMVAMVALGALGQRLLAAAWAEDLDATATLVTRGDGDALTHDRPRYPQSPHLVVQATVHPTGSPTEWSS